MMRGLLLFSLLLLLSHPPLQAEEQPLIGDLLSLEPPPEELGDISGIPRNENIRELIRDLKNKSPFIRYRAAEKLGEIEDEGKKKKKVVKALKRRLKKEKVLWVRRAIEKALLKLERKVSKEKAIL